MGRAGVWRPGASESPPTGRPRHFQQVQAPWLALIALFRFKANVIHVIAICAVIGFLAGGLAGVASLRPANAIPQGG